MSMPNNLKQYIHRVGRTARGSASGTSVTLVGEKERKILKEIVKGVRKGMLQLLYVKRACRSLCPHVGKPGTTIYCMCTAK